MSYFTLLIDNYWVNEMYPYLLIIDPKKGKIEIFILLLFANVNYKNLLINTYHFDSNYELLRSYPYHVQGLSFTTLDLVNIAN